MSFYFMYLFTVCYYLFMYVCEINFLNLFCFCLGFLLFSVFFAFLGGRSGSLTKPVDSVFVFQEKLGRTKRPCCRSCWQTPRATTTSQPASSTGPAPAPCSWKNPSCTITTSSPRRSSTPSASLRKSTRTTLTTSFCRMSQRCLAAGWWKDFARRRRECGARGAAPRAPSLCSSLSAATVANATAGNLPCGDMRVLSAAESPQLTPVPIACIAPSSGATSACTFASTTTRNGTPSPTPSWGRLKNSPN